MKQYHRAKQKRLDLISVYDYTIDSVNEKRPYSCRKNKGSTFLHNPKDYGERENQPGRGGTEAWGRAVQHQQSDAQENRRECRFLVENSGEHRAGSGTENAAQKIGKAA